MENKKNSWVLWLGLGIPVVALIFVAIFAYMPSNLETKYDFLYYSKTYNNYCGGNDLNTYKVNNQKISVVTKNDIPADSYRTYSCNNVVIDPPRIYRYNVAAGTSNQISLVDAQKLLIDNNQISPDNISIQRGGYNNMGVFELFGSGNNYNSIYLKNNKNQMKKIDLGITDYYNFSLIGWVLN